MNRFENLLARVIAHRGASAYQPENSLAAFRAAEELGADGVELDVHTTLDGVAIVHHDAVADSHRIAEVRLGELRDHKLPNGEAIPLLADALSTLGTKLLVFVEVKTLPAEHDDRLLDVLRAGPAPGNYHVHSFDHRIIKRLKQRQPSLISGVLSASYPVKPLDQLEDAGATELWQVENQIDAGLIEAAHDKDYRVYAWTVDDPTRMRQLIEMGVDAICTNRPDVARRVVE
ncbi:MAG: glycerophosphodiester phosphodiesterase [Gemmatimonadota bacterium]|nr:MAG: glycerophosphodiester phosphodiesterase [Gemmatimonadota bacterium]